VTRARIEQRFAARRAEKRAVLIAYLVVGEPSVEDSVACALAAVRGGADLLELGVPFSDPTADGPVIAAAQYRAIHNGGSLRAAFAACEAIRRESDVPIVLMTYYNPIFTFGDEQAVLEAQRVDADGFLVVDLPSEEGPALRERAAAAELSIIPMVAPTTGREREPRVLHGASGFVYYVSVTGVTGTGAAPLVEAGREAAALRERAGVPTVVGFGIRSADDARAVCAQGVDGIAVGTEIVRRIAAHPDRAGRVQAVESLLAELRAAV
jgi:tryptophan synthase alpha chain